MTNEKVCRNRYVSSLSTVKNYTTEDTIITLHYIVSLNVYVLRYQLFGPSFAAKEFANESWRRRQILPQNFRKILQIGARASNNLHLHVCQCQIPSHVYPCVMVL